VSRFRPSAILLAALVVGVPLAAGGTAAETLKPTVTIDPTSTPRNPTNQTSATFRFSSSKESSTFRCRLDDGRYRRCTSPKTYSSLREGQHTFRVRATDASGQTGPAAIFSWTIDLTPPAVPTIASAPAHSTSTADASFAFSNSEAGLAFGCQLDGSAFTPCASPTRYTRLPEGSHTFAVRAIDLAGNFSGAASYSWRVLDTTAPGNVRLIRRSVGYGILRLAWRRPADADYVRVFVAKGSKAARGRPRTVVYRGTGTHYTNRRFKNGTHYRYAIVSYDRAGNASRGLPVIVRPSALLRAPRDGALVHAPPRLVWVGVAEATFYNVQLYLGRRKVLSAWPTAARLTLRQRWFYSARSFRLKQGTYRWYVWPAFGTRARTQFGRPLGVSTFTVR
jgi:hypothetical protein